MVENNELDKKLNEINQNEKKKQEEKEAKKAKPAPVELTPEQKAANKKKTKKQLIIVGCCVAGVTALSIGAMVGLYFVYHNGRISGKIEPPVYISLETSSCERSVYIDNKEWVVEYSLDHLGQKNERIGVTNEYLYYNVVCSYKISCTLTIGGKTYNDSRLSGNCYVNVTSDCPEWSGGTVSHSIPTGSTKSYTLTLKEINAGKIKSDIDYHYYISLSC